MTDFCERFKQAKISVLSESAVTEGVGGLMEKSVHKILKLAIEPDVSKHEQKYLGSVVDIKNGEGIFEIQTKNHAALIPKLRKFLPTSPVTVVIPLINEKYIRYIDTETGEISAPQKSPKHEDVYTALNYIFKLSDFVMNKNFRLKLIFMSADEYRRLDGWDKSRKKGATKLDKIPRDVIEVLDLSSREDYIKHIPRELGERFLAKEFQKAIKRPAKFTYFIIRFLCNVGVISEIGKEGRAFVYALNK